MENSVHKVIGEARLENGWTIRYEDRSRPTPGSHWQVRLWICVPVDVKKEYFAEYADPESMYSAFSEALGTTVCFEQEKVRHFVPEAEVQATLQALREEFERASLAYFLKPSFAAKVVMKKVKEWQEEQEAQEVRKAHIEAIRHADSEK